MKTKWERREAKEGSKRRFVADNRVSIRLLEKISTNGKPETPKKGKKLKR